MTELISPAGDWPSLKAAIDAGATTINLPDTVGFRLPDEIAEMVGYVIDKVNIGGIIYSVHMHNDLGLATGNTLAGIKAGARQAEVTVNGIGERAGNTALEEVVAAIFERSVERPINGSNYFGNLKTGIITQKIKLKD